MLQECVTCAAPIKFEATVQPQLSAGSIHAFCVNTQGSLFCWGRGADARLGLGDKQDRWVPTLLSGAFGVQLVKQVSAGSFH